MLGRILRLRSWWDEVEPGVMLGARPLPRDVPKLYALGVRGVVNMCDEYRGPTEAYQQLGIEQRWLRTVDFQPPSLDAVHQGVEFVQQMLEKDHKVYVHCKAGRARSATIVLCWLMKYRSMTAKQAQAILLNKRPHVKADLDKRQVVLDYAQQLSHSES
jgi:atypical dual specificity phosphatase